jgi:UDP-3-O-[3-hydroxymyristoyl] glucosamine N-acyltransferase
MAHFTVRELADRLGGEVEGDGERALTGVRSLEDAGPEHLSFLANPRYYRKLTTTGAGAILVDGRARAPGRTLIRVADPYAAFADALTLFHPQPWPAGRVDPRAAVAPDARLAPGVVVEAFATVGSGAAVGEGTWIQGGAYVGAGAQIGARCRLMPTSVVMDGCVLGDEVWLNPGAIVGGEGFGFAPTPQGLMKIPQVGRAVLEDRVELGANSCVDRAAMGETRVGRGAKFDNFCQVGHAAEIGPHSCLVAYAGVAGTSRLGAGVTVAARSSVLGHLNIGDGVTVAAHSMVARDAEPGARLSGVPAGPHERWLKASVALGRLPELVERVRELEARLAALEES